MAGPLAGDRLPRRARTSSGSPPVQLVRLDQEPSRWGGVDPVSEEEVDSRPLRDDMAFNDPAAWGFCEMCAFEVAVTKGEGKRIEHRRIRNGHEDSLCTGSYKVPIGPTPAHAVARKQISLRKDANRAQRRAHWQRRRWHARENVANFNVSISPVSVIATDDYGNEVDLT